VCLLKGTGYSKKTSSFIIFSCNSRNDNQINEERIKNNAFEIKSINPHNEDFKDLEPLKKSIGDSRIVLLGEAEHGNRSTFYFNLS